MKQKLIALLFLIIPVVLFTSAAIFCQVFAETDKVIYFFYGNGCPHCAVVEEYFDEEGILQKYPVEAKEIYGNRDNALLYSELVAERGLNNERLGVPAVIIGDQVIVGDRPIINQFVSVADEYLASEDEAEAFAIDQSATDAAEETEVVEADQTQQPGVDQALDRSDQSSFDLTIIAVIGASIVDAINPCAFAVLIILMTTILVSGNGSKALRAGLAFAASIFISYLLMGLGLYKALELGGFSNVFFKIVGWLAILLGIFNLKDFFWYGKGFVMEVPMSWRPTMKGLIKSVTSPMGAFLVGFVVSSFLLPCTSGPYIVILGMLAKEPMNLRAISYLVLYNLIFVLPMILISIAVYKGFDPNKAEAVRQKQLRVLHLIAGLVMLAMGTVILMGWI